MAIRLGLPIVAAALVLSWACLWLEWYEPALWFPLVDHVPLSSTACAGAITLVGSLVLFRLATPFGPVAIGLAPRRLAHAFAIGIAVWAADQIANAIDGGSVSPIHGDVLGAILAAFGEEVLYRFGVLGALMKRGLVTAIAVSAVLFVLSHVPHDIATDDIARIERLPLLLAYGVLLALVYVRTGNLLICVVLHVLVNEPLLVVTGPHAQTLTSAVDWLACVLVIACAREPRLQAS